MWTELITSLAALVAVIVGFFSVVRMLIRIERRLTVIELKLYMITRRGDLRLIQKPPIVRRRKKDGC